jgi:hypothetical protein
MVTNKAGSLLLLCHDLDTCPVDMRNALASASSPCSIHSSPLPELGEVPTQASLEERICEFIMQITKD